MRDVGAIRTFLALAGSGVGVLIALYQKHFVLDLAVPASFYEMVHHRCGWVLMAAVGWSLVECAIRVGRAAMNAREVRSERRALILEL